MLPAQIDGPVITISDLHGADDQLRTLLGFLIAHGLHEGRHLIFLGDFVMSGQTRPARLTCCSTGRNCTPRSRSFLATMI